MLEKCIEDLLHLRKQTKTASYNNDNGRKIYKRKHIHHLEVVKKKSIYGMWIDEVYFVKVYLHDPNDKTRLADILDVSINIKLHSFIPLICLYFILSGRSFSWHFYANI
jgi:hypothetical protein